MEVVIFIIVILQEIIGSGSVGVDWQGGIVGGYAGSTGEYVI